MTQAFTRRKNRFLQDRIVLSFDFPGSGFVAATSATGTIQCAANTAGADGDTVTISDGYTTQVYEYDKSSNGVVAGHIAFGPGTTADSVALLLRTAILATQPAFTIVDNGTGLLTLTNQHTGAAGNVPITHSGAITTSVTGMSGGADAVATSITSTTSYKFHECEHVLLLEKAMLVDPIGLATDDTNYFVITVQNGATVMATWSTKTTGGQGSLPANTFTAMVLSAVSGALDALPGAVLSLVLTLHGTQTLPPGRLELHARYL